MKETIKKLWVEALLSGKYKQGVEVLASIDARCVVRHCCLGVLCEVMLREGMEIKVATKFQGKVYDVESERVPESLKVYDGQAHDLPVTVMERSGMKTRVGLNDETKSLVQMNDEGRSFEEIAGVIERNWETL